MGSIECPVDLFPRGKELFIDGFLGLSDPFLPFLPKLFPHLVLADFEVDMGFPGNRGVSGLRGQLACDGFPSCLDGLHSLLKLSTPHSCPVFVPVHHR